MSKTLTGLCEKVHMRAVSAHMRSVGAQRRCLGQTQQARILLDGYELSAESGERIHVPQSATWADCERIAQQHGITLYRRGERLRGAQPVDQVCIADECYTYVVGSNGKPKAL